MLVYKSVVVKLKYNKYSQSSHYHYILHVLLQNRCRQSLRDCAELSEVYCVPRVCIHYRAANESPQSFHRARRRPTLAFSLLKEHTILAH